MYTKTELKNRGWSDALIKKFLPEPDATKVNMQYSGGPKIKLYQCDRIEKLEASSEFIDAKAETERKRESARRGVATKRAKLKEYVAKLTIEVPVLKQDELMRLARQNFRTLEIPFEVEISDEQMCVNYLRHCCTQYEEELHKIVGKCGKQEAYLEIKGKVLAAIGDTYAWLQEECWRQEDQMWKEMFDEI